MQLRYERNKAMGLESKLLEYSDKLLIAQEENRRLMTDNFVKPAPIAFQSATSLNHAQVGILVLILFFFLSFSSIYTVN